MVSKQDLKALEVVKANIKLSLDKLVNDYNVFRCDLQIAWENTEVLYDYTLSKNKIKEEDKVPLLILTHNYYLNHLLDNYRFNNNYKIYPLKKDEIKFLYEGLRGIK